MDGRWNCIRWRPPGAGFLLSRTAGTATSWWGRRNWRWRRGRRWGDGWRGGTCRREGGRAVGERGEEVVGAAVVGPGAPGELAAPAEAQAVRAAPGELAALEERE